MGKKSPNTWRDGVEASLWASLDPSKQNFQTRVIDREGEASLCNRVTSKSKARKNLLVRISSQSSPLN